MGQAERRSDRQSGFSRLARKTAVDRLGHLGGGREIGDRQLQAQAVAEQKGSGHRALDRGAVRHAPGRQVVDLHLGAAGGSPRAPHQHVALRHRIDLAVGALQRRHQQRAAAQALGVAERRHRDVDLLAGLRERRQRGRDHHRGHVAQLQTGALRQRDAQLREHRLQALRGERRLRGLVAAAVQTHHQAVADQLVRPYTLDRGQVLDALRVRHAGGERSERNEGTQQAADHRRHLRTARTNRRSATASP